MSNSALALLAQQERTRREILHKSDLIPPLPDVVVRVVSLLNRTDTDPVQLENHLRLDQVLVAKMLGLVNSPFYGLRSRVSTVRDAIMVLGFRGLRSLILATSTAKFLARDFRCYGFAERGLWLHSLTVAAAARALCRKLAGTPELYETMFVAGLMHDIGKMLLAPYLTERRVVVASATDPGETERRVVGLDHTEAGALVVAKWNLAPVVQEVVKHHHTAANPPIFARECALVRVANHLACAKGYGYDIAHRAFLDPIDGALCTLELDATRFTALQPELAESMDAAVTAMANLAS